MILKSKLYICFLCLFFILSISGCNLIVNNEKAKDTKKVQDPNEGIEYESGDVLPLGTIISLKDSNDKLMIIGWTQMQIDNDDNDKIYDYAACKYPEGVFSGKDIRPFNDEDIGRIYFYGYIDDDSTKMRKEVIKQRNNIRNKNDELKEEYKINDNITENKSNTKNYLLSLGTVVSVEGKDSKYIIIGRLIRGKDDKLFDYYACLYPDGNVSRSDNILFNQDEVKDIHFNGYEGAEEKERNKKLLKYKESIEK